MDLSRLIAYTFAWIVVLGVPLAVLFYVGRSWFSAFERTVVFEFQQGLKYRNGRLVGVVKPGGYWMRRNRATIVRVDMREQLVEIDRLEVVPRDNVPTRLNAAANYRVVDPVAAFTTVVDHGGVVSTMIQLALRKAASTMTSKDLFRRTDELARHVIESTQDRQRELGISLGSVEVTA
jgi:regulator of protease activity HflC (stomatin/prohibitin superfamily)